MNLTREQVQKFHEWSMGPFPNDDNDDENVRYRKKCEAIAPQLAEALLKAWDAMDEAIELLKRLRDPQIDEAGTAWIDEFITRQALEESK